MKVTLALLAVVVLAVGVNSAYATAITVPNGSFESETIGDGAKNWGAPPNWTYTNCGNGYFSSYRCNPDDTQITGAADGDATPDTIDGLNVWRASGSHSDADPEADPPEPYEPGWITITTTGSLGTAKAGYTYDLTVAVGGWLADPGDIDMQIDILFDGTSVASATKARVDLISDGALEDISASCVATGGEDITVALTALNPLPHTELCVFDNVRLDEVPEPSTLALLGLGAVVLKLRRKR